VNLSWLTGPSVVEVSCLVDIEQTPEFLHAHAIPEGIDIRPGDTVIVHDAPTHVDFGERLTVRCRATVYRANWLQRNWTQLTGLLEFAELYEVGFSPKEHA
jgi:hypothetical protein